MTYTLGTYVVVRYGSKGEQLALYTGFTPRYYKVRKWLKNGRRWTASATISSSQILRNATDADVRRFNPEYPT